MAPETQAWMALMWCAGMGQQKIAHLAGASGAIVSQQIKNFCRDWAGVDVMARRIYGNYRKPIAARALKNYVEKLGSVYLPTHSPVSYPNYADARREHAWLLRAEGMVYRKIGAQLGVSGDRARGMIIQFSWRMQRASRRCRFRIA